LQLFNLKKKKKKKRKKRGEQRGKEEKRGYVSGGIANGRNVRKIGKKEEQREPCETRSHIEKEATCPISSTVDDRN